MHIAHVLCDGQQNGTNAGKSSAFHGSYFKSGCGGPGLQISHNMYIEMVGNRTLIMKSGEIIFEFQVMIIHVPGGLRGFVCW